jgi:hypothetical protein
MNLVRNDRLPSRAEKLVSVAVLVILGAVLAWLLGRQAQFSPAVVAGSPAAEQTTGGELADLLTPWPAGLHAMSRPERFTPETLSDKINGKAELYLAAGFESMICQRATLVGAPESWMELFVYDMGKPASAFSVYSAQKRREALEWEMGDYAYVAGNQVCLVHGRYYLEVVGADAGEATVAAGRALARAFVSATAVDSHADVGRESALFPVEGLVPGSITLLSSDVFGFDRLQNVFTARFRDGGDEITLFLARREEPAEAAELLAAFRGFLIEDCGGVELAGSGVAPGLLSVDLGGVFESAFATGAYLGGTHEAPSQELAERWAARLRDRVEGGGR